MKPRLYLTTPPDADPDALAEALDAADVACLRVYGADDAELAAAVRRFAPVAHARNAALLLADAPDAVDALGADGVHFDPGAPDRLTAARERLGSDRIIGVSCGVSRHAGLVAGEQGVDFVAFGPVGEGEAEPALFAWWQELIEVPVVAEGGLTPGAAAALWGAADFLHLGAEIWRAPDGPVAAIRAFDVALDAAGRAHADQAAPG